MKSRVGDMDVADVHRARELCLERMPHLDPDKVPFKSTTCTGALKLPAGGSDGWLAWRLSGDPSGRATPRQLQGGCCKEPCHQHCKVCFYYVMNRVFGRARLMSIGQHQYKMSKELLKFWSSVTYLQTSPLARASLATSPSPRWAAASSPTRGAR